MCGDEGIYLSKSSTSPSQIYLVTLKKEQHLYIDNVGSDWFTEMPAAGTTTARLFDPAWALQIIQNIVFLSMSNHSHFWLAFRARGTHVAYSHYSMFCAVGVRLYLHVWFFERIIHHHCCITEQQLCVVVGRRPRHAASKWTLWHVELCSSAMLTTLWCI